MYRMIDEGRIFMLCHSSESELELELLDELELVE